MLSADNDNMHNTTNFHNDAGVRETTLDGQKALGPQFYKNPEDMTKTDLAFYLGRPTRIQAGVLAIGDSATQFTALAMPQYMLTLPIYADKPRGRYGFRATMVFRLVINAERFQQGRYMLTYCPTGGARYGSAQKGNAWVNKHSATLVQRTCLPHVEFDLATDSEVTLRIPYASIHDFYQFSWANDLTNGLGTWGVLRLFPYSPLVSPAGSVTANYTIYGHFEDIEFVGFSSTAIVPQSGNPYGAGKSISRMEQQANRVGPVESLAVKVKKAAEYLTPVPMLSNFAGPVSWASEIVAGVASVFGWSAPLNIEKSSRFQITNYAYWGNVNKIDNSRPVAYTTNNEVAVAPGFSSTDVDELDLVSLSKISAYFKQAAWGSSYIVGYELFSVTLNPGSFYTTSTYHGITYFNYTPVSWVQNYFALWRGSINIKIKIVKTEFHSGRIAISYYPNGDTTRTLDRTDYLHREIIDIRMQNEITITIPWTSPTTYKPLDLDNGVLSCHIVDALVAPATVSDTVTFLIEVSGGPDIEFAGAQRVITQTSCPDFTVQSGDPFKTTVETAAIAKMIGAAAPPKFQLDTSQLCIGERITSFRQLLKRFAGIYCGSLGNNNFLYTLPFGVPTLGTVTTTDSFTLQGDLYAELANIFMFSRGGVRYKIFPNMGADYKVGVSLSIANLYLNAATKMIQTGGVALSTNKNSSALTTVSKSSYAFYNTAENGAIEIDVPQYYINKSRNNAEHVIAVSQPYSTTYATDLGLTIFAVNSSGVKVSTFDVPDVYRAGSDDCNFGLFVSIPPMATNPVDS